LIGSRYDWGYSTEPESGLEGRRIPFPRGKAFGGSSAINAMAHIRGHRLCFDRWRELGNAGWGYDDLLPLFRRSERYDGGNSTYRGADGPLAVSRGTDPHEGHHAFLAAAEERGFRADAAHDFNGPAPEGVAGFYQKNILNGRRHSAAAAFLLPALARPNVDVRSSAHVTRLLVEGRRAVGVEYIRGGQLGTVRARREVILCGGAVESPRLLMRSGIGPADHLREHGIAVVADVPGVGQNLQDHIKLSLRWRGRGTLPGSTVTAGLFTSSRSASPPDLQFYVGRGLAQPDAFVTITVSLVRPQARGEIRLRSHDPLTPPIIRARYLQAAADIEAVVSGARLARALGTAAAYDSLRGEETEPGPQVSTAADLEHFARRAADTIYHAAGTCRMGPSSDPTAVVDATLRVRGVEGLRVADASIMPEVVNATTHAACVVIGDKCATLVSGRSEG
jgi:choline dehydrogenase